MCDCEACQRQLIGRLPACKCSTCWRSTPTVRCVACCPPALRQRHPPVSAAGRRRGRGGRRGGFHHGGGHTAAALDWWGENPGASAAAGDAGAGGRGGRRAVSEAQHSMAEAGSMLTLVTCTRHAVGAVPTMPTVTVMSPCAHRHVPGWQHVPGPAGKPASGVVWPDCRHSAAQGTGRAGACAGTRGLVQAGRHRPPSCASR